jgi:hypothetical protein
VLAADVLDPEPQPTAAMHPAIIPTRAAALAFVVLDGGD